MEINSVQHYSKPIKTILNFIHQIVKDNVNAEAVDKWNDKLQDFNKREFVLFWDAFFK